MYPVGTQIINEEYNRTEPPGKRIRPENDVDAGNETNDDADIDNADQTIIYKNNESRLGAFYLTERI